jgi:hypothetical protein
MPGALRTLANNMLSMDETSRITEGCGILSTRPSAAGPSSKWSKGWERLIDLGKKIQLKSACNFLDEL